MTDIVERLRDRPMICWENEGCYLLGMAADEIERLRIKIERLRSALVFAEEFSNHPKVVERARLELDWPPQIG